MQSENFGSIRESSHGCMLNIVLCTKKLHFISRNWGRKNNTVASGFSSIKIHYSVNRINKVYVFSIKYRYRISYCKT